MMSRFWFTLTILLAVLLGHSEAEAQLFGQRNLGRSSISRRTGPGSAADGQLSGNERFLRGNRSRRAFVGSDAAEARSFVGSEQSTVTGQVRSATSGMRPPPDRSSTINRPLPSQPANARYYPRLKVEFAKGAESGRYAASAVQQELETSDALSRLGQIEVSVANQTATLRGEVASESDRKLAALIASFEPGIDRVQNELAVNNALRVPPVPPQPGIEPRPNR